MKKLLITFFTFITITLIYPSQVLADCQTTECPGTTGPCVEDRGRWICQNFGAPPPIPAGCNPVTEANTALGCIPTDPGELVKWVLKYGIIIGSGIAFLLSLSGGLTIILASGNPEKINQGKETITSAISGLLFIVLAVFLLRLIGYDILQLPDFTP